MKIVIIDNYDSFTYNLSHLVKELGAEVTVVRNDQFNIGDLEAYDKIILSPGPGIRSASRRHPYLRRSQADTRRLPGPSGHRTGVWRTTGEYD